MYFIRDYGRRTRIYPRSYLKAHALAQPSSTFGRNPLLTLHYTYLNVNLPFNVCILVYMYGNFLIFTPFRVSSHINV